MKPNTKLNLTLGGIALLLLGFIVWAEAGAYGHAWVKMSQANVTNAYGSPVVQCVWRCQVYDHNGHTTITQGHGYCPMPM